MAWHERDLGAFGRIRECLPEHYPSSFGLRALFSASERRPPLSDSGPAGEPRGLLSIIGPDDRERRTDTELPPLSMICSITATDAHVVSHGTGWLVSPRVVITAAHVLQDSTQNFAALTAVIRPGREVGKEPFGAFAVQATDWKIAPGYNGMGPASADFAAIRLASDAIPSFGYFGVGALSDAALADRLVTIGGYPQWVGAVTNVIPEDEQYLRMYIHRDRILSLRPGQIFYDVDTFRGQSGAPVVIMPRDGDPFSGPVVVGIHSRGKDPDQAAILRDNNSATRITASVMDFIRDFVGGTIASLAVTAMLIVGMAFAGLGQEALAQETSPAGFGPMAMPLALVDLSEGNTITLPRTGQAKQQFPSSAAPPDIPRKIADADVRVAALLEHDCGGERRATQRLRPLVGQRCRLSINVTTPGLASYMAEIHLAATNDAMQTFSFAFTGRSHWVWLTLSIFAGIPVGSILVSWHGKRGLILRQGPRKVGLNERLAQLSANGVTRARSLPGKPEAVGRKLERDLKMDDLDECLVVLDKILQIRCRAADVARQSTHQESHETDVAQSGCSKLSYPKIFVDGIRYKADELCAERGANAAEIRECGIDIARQSKPQSMPQCLNAATSAPRLRLKSLSLSLSPCFAPG